MWSLLLTKAEVTRFTLIEQYGRFGKIESKVNRVNYYLIKGFNHIKYGKKLTKIP